MISVRYGFDAPLYPLAGLVGAAGFFVAWGVAGSPVLGWGILFAAAAAVFVLSSAVGKPYERDVLLDSIEWRGDEAVLDVGCGRGLLLVGAARRLVAASACEGAPGADPSRAGEAHRDVEEGEPGASAQGSVVGVDVWRRRDQAGNSAEITLRNVADAGVGDRVLVRDGDARELPFGDATFDVVMSNLVVHNIRGAEGKYFALSEMVRVLKPGGSLAISDVGLSRRYGTVISMLGMEQIRHRWRLPLFLVPFGMITARRPVGSGMPRDL